VARLTRIIHGSPQVGKTCVADFVDHNDKQFCQSPDEPPPYPHEFAGLSWGQELGMHKAPPPEMD
jgi:hypothetical protein